MVNHGMDKAERRSDTDRLIIIMVWGVIVVVIATAITEMLGYN